MERGRVMEGTARFGTRAGQALRRPHNWLQLAKFCAVGVTGYVVNLAVFTVLYEVFSVHYRPAAVCSFVVAVTNNYLWNRLWTFRGQRGHFYYQGLRFFVVAWCALAANLLVLEGLVTLGLDPVPAQAIAIIVVTPVNFIGNKLWSFRHRH
jgi:dolichol-phosphate mannosyltransferase